MDFKEYCSEHGLHGTLCYSPKTEEFYFCDSSGYLLTHSETEAVISGLQNQLKNYTDEGIEEHNHLNDLEWERQEWGSSSHSEDPKPPIPARPGHIYFIQDGEGRVKIGKTVKMSERVKEYTKLPVAPMILHTFLTTNYDDAEKLIHGRYAAQRLRGEWFALTGEDIEFIKSGDLEKIVISLLNGL